MVAVIADRLLPRGSKKTLQFELQRGVKTLNEGISNGTPYHTAERSLS